MPLGLKIDCHLELITESCPSMAQPSHLWLWLAWSHAPAVASEVSLASSCSLSSPVLSSSNNHELLGLFYKILYLFSPALHACAMVLCVWKVRGQRAEWIFSLPDKSLGLSPIAFICWHGSPAHFILCICECGSKPSEVRRASSWPHQPPLSLQEHWDYRCRLPHPA